MFFGSGRNIRYRNQMTGDLILRQNIKILTTLLRLPIMKFILKAYQNQGLLFLQLTSTMLGTVLYKAKSSVKPTRRYKCALLLNFTIIGEYKRYCMVTTKCQATPPISFWSRTSFFIKKYRQIKLPTQLSTSSVVLIIFS